MRMSGWLSTVSFHPPDPTRLAQGHPLTSHASGGLLQPNQPPLWRHYRILLAPDLPRDEGDRRVRSNKSLYMKTNTLTQYRFEYLWQDTENYKRPTKMPAPAYIEQLMTWVQGNIDNEAVLPSRIGVPFPKSFPALVRQIFKRMYRVYAHIYCHHYPVIRELGLEPHLNTSFKQYVLFIDEHNLATGKDFWGPLGDLVDSMLRSD